MDVCILLQAPRRNIGLLCSILAGYEGVAILRTVNAAHGLLELLVAPAFYDTALSLLHTLAHDIDVHVIDANRPIDLPCET